VGLVKSRAEAGLVAPFLHRINEPIRHISDQQLDGIGADVDHRSAACVHLGAKRSLISPMAATQAKIRVDFETRMPSL
jgi:hypothetical protein